MIVPAAIVVAAAPCSSSSSSAVAVVVPALPLARPMATSVVIFIAVAVVSAVAAALGRHFLVDKKRESQKYSEQGGGGRRRKKKTRSRPCSSLFQLSLSLSLSLPGGELETRRVVLSLSLFFSCPASLSPSLSHSHAPRLISFEPARERAKEKKEREGQKTSKNPSIGADTPRPFSSSAAPKRAALSRKLPAAGRTGGAHTRASLSEAQRARTEEKDVGRRTGVSRSTKASERRERESGVGHQTSRNVGPASPAGRRDVRAARRADRAVAPVQPTAGAGGQGALLRRGGGEKKREDVFFLASMVKTFRRRSSAKNDDNAHFLSFPTSKKPLSLSLSLSSPLFFFFFFHNTGALRHGP